MTNIVKEIEKCDNILEIFKLVKKSVKDVLNLSRGGLMIGIQNIPIALISYYLPSLNMIVLNENIISRISLYFNSKEELNSLLFYVILREYLSSFGFNKELVKQYAIKVCKEIFGKEHFCTFIAERGLDHIFPDINSVNEELLYYAYESKILILKDTSVEDSMLYV